MTPRAIPRQRRGCVARILLFLGCLYLLCLVFAPSLDLGPGGIIGYHDIVLALAAPFSVLNVLANPKVQRVIHATRTCLFIGLYLFSLHVMVSTLANSYQGLPNLPGMYKELARLVEYVVVVLVFSGIPSDGRPTIRRTVLAAGAGLVILQLAQYWGSQSFNRAIARLYGNGIHFQVAVSSTSRATGGFYAGGSFANPNVAGTFLLMPWSLSLWQLRSLTRRDRQYRTTRIRGLTLIGYVLLLGAGIALTRSRATLFAAVLILLLISLREMGLQTKLKGIRRKKLGFAIVVCGAIAVVVFSMGGPASSFERFRAGFREEGSYHAKIANFREGLQEMVGWEAMFGLGPHGGPQADFEYGYFFLWYGPLGFLSYAFFWHIIVKNLIRFRKHFIAWQALLLIVMGMLLVNLSQTTFLVARIFPIFLALYLSHIRPYKLDRATIASSLPQSENSLLSVRTSNITASRQ